MFMNKKFDDFLWVTKLLNDFGIKPVLYGSLGLYRIINPLGPADDIDILVPEVYLKRGWSEFRGYLESNGFRMDDEHEHEFSHPKIEGFVAFGSIEGSQTHSGLKMDDARLTTLGGVSFYELTPFQFLRAYQASLKDNYRQERKNGADEQKIKALEEYLGKGKGRGK